MFSSKPKEGPESEADVVARQQAFEKFEHDNPRCRVCGDPATYVDPKVGRAWLDKVPLFSWFNRLYALNWRYTVEDPWFVDPAMCKEHHKEGHEHLQHFIASLRNDHAAFNAEQVAKVVAMNGGGLVSHLRTSHKRITNMFDMPAEPQLTEGSDE